MNDFERVGFFELVIWTLAWMSFCGVWLKRQGVTVAWWCFSDGCIYVPFDWMNFKWASAYQMSSDQNRSHVSLTTSATCCGTAIHDISKPIIFERANICNFIIPLPINHLWSDNGLIVYILSWLFLYEILSSIIINFQVILKASGLVVSLVE